MDWVGLVLFSCSFMAFFHLLVPSPPPLSSSSFCYPFLSTFCALLRPMYLRHWFQHLSFPYLLPFHGAVRPVAVLVAIFPTISTGVPTIASHCTPDSRLRSKFLRLSLLFLGSLLIQKKNLSTGLMTLRGRFTASYIIPLS